MNYDTIRIDDQLVLRQLKTSEAAEMFQLVDGNRDYLRPWLPWVDATNQVEDTQAFIEDNLRQCSAGTTYGYGIFYDGQLVGHMSLMNLSAAPEIGYWIAEAMTGKGITTRCVTALTELGLEILKLPEIVIKADPANVSSNRVAEKAGYRLIEHRREPEGEQNVWSIRAESQ